MKKIVILFDGNFEVSGQVFHYRQGDVLEVPEADAERLVAGKCAEYPETKKEVKHERKNKQQVDAGLR